MKIEAAHHLPMLGSDHPCANVHGHSYVFTVGVSASTLDDKGMVIDFGVLAMPIKTLDHQDLNKFLPNPTAECLAQFIWDELDMHVIRPSNAGEADPKGHVQLDFIEVRETENCVVRLTR